LTNDSRKISNLLNSFFQGYRLYLKSKEILDSQSSTEVLFHQNYFQILQFSNIYPRIIQFF